MTLQIVNRYAVVLSYDTVKANLINADVRITEISI